MTAATVTLFSDRTERWGLVEGDAVALLPKLPDSLIDAVLTDPPYNLAMHGAHGQRWDRHGSPAAFANWTRQWAAECRRVLKPGGYLVAFGAPRTFHRLASGIEDAGLEIRDVLVWLHPPGMPKSRRMTGGLGSALKPAYEPIILARVPPVGTLADNLAAYGTGAMDIQAAAVCRPGEPDRWPTNVVLSHHAACADARCADDCPAGLLDAQRPDRRPSRFFYCPKASTAEREAGCGQLPEQFLQIYNDSARCGRQARNIHPTVKPIALMRWLVRLTCPPGGMVLDPFTGSGTTGAAVMSEDRRFLGIEREGAYVDLACARITHWAQPTGAAP